jgi:hypothetical protein
MLIVLLRMFQQFSPFSKGHVEVNKSSMGFCVMIGAKREPFSMVIFPPSTEGTT